MTKKPDDSRFRLTPVDRQFLARAARNDYAAFASTYFNATLIPWQRFFLQHHAKDKLVVAGIRSGKSFADAVLSLHFAFWNPHSRVLNVCITVDQARVVYQEIINLADSPAFRHWIDGEPTFHPYPRLRLRNGAEIWARSIGGPGGTADRLRGWEFDVITLDEAAYVVNPAALMTLRGRLIGFNKEIGQPRYGLFVMTTTPTSSASGWLYERWKKGDPAFPDANPDKYLSLRARTYDNPFLSKDVIAEIEASYTERQRRQELEGLFLSEDAMFPLEDLLACCGKYVGENIIDVGGDDDIDPVVADLNRAIVAWLKASDRRYRDIVSVPETIEHYELDPEPGRMYVAGWDLGSRTLRSGKAAGRNATVGVVFDVTQRPWRMAAYRYLVGMRYTASMAEVKRWHLKYNGNGAFCATRIDAAGPGDVIHQMLEEEEYKIDGFRANTASKAAILQAAKICIERRDVRFPYIAAMIRQFQDYTPNDHNIAQDIVMAVAQALHFAVERDGEPSSSRFDRSKYRNPYDDEFERAFDVRRQAMLRRFAGVEPNRRTEYRRMR